MNKLEKHKLKIIVKYLSYNNIIMKKHKQNNR